MLANMSGLNIPSNSMRTRHVPCRQWIYQIFHRGIRSLYSKWSAMRCQTSYDGSQAMPSPYALLPVSMLVAPPLPLSTSMPVAVSVPCA